MISVQNISLSFGDRKLFSNLTVSISDGEKLAVCGRNGSGKSSFFKLIMREMLPDSGTISIQGQKTIACLKQELPQDTGFSVRDEVIQSKGDVLSIRKRIAQLQNLIEEHHDQDSLMMNFLHEMDDLHSRLEFIDADKLDGKVEKILIGLGFTNEDLDKKATTFSGGWRMRIELAKLLIAEPDILLLDEPNNHLDIVSLRWLEGFLSEYTGTVIIISHDLMFLDKIAKRIIEFDRGTVYDFKGNYTAYLSYRAERKEIETKEFESQQKVIQHKEMLIEKFRYKASKASFAQSLITELNRMELKELPENEASSISLRFNPSHASGVKVLEIKDLFKSFGTKKVLEDVQMYLGRGECLSFIGANGNGKSTLVKLICKELQPDKGIVELGHNVKVGYYAQEHSSILDHNKTAYEAVEDNCIASARPKLRTILGGLGLSGEDAEKKISVLSGGEKARVRLAMLLVNEHNFLILDEPTHHLDIPSKAKLKDALLNYSGTVIIVSHDRDFLKGLAGKTILFENNRIKVFEGDIEYYLEKSESDDLFTGIKNTGNSGQPENYTLDYQARKKIQRQAQNLEKEISKIEQSIREIEIIMADEGFYQNSECQSILKNYEQHKAKHAVLFEEWLNVSAELEK